MAEPGRGGHRREIDGLRAIAVAGVVLDHAGVPGFSAGFAGVDLFFVISGFLIGGITLQALAEGRFGFAEFYARRARRILPALFVMMLVSFPFGWVLMAPQELRYYGGGAFATLVFLSNVWFLQRIDYFNPELATDPLLHTWSLAVEEQFYLVLPVLLIGLWRLGLRGRGIAAVLAGLALASFALALTTPPMQAMTGFYLGHTRAWELLAGVLASMVYRAGQGLDPRLRGGLALVGLGLALGAITLIPGHGDSAGGWPGGWTLVPVLGAVLVLLFADHPGWARRVLSWAPAVGLGAVSYSVYLWHQPILGFLAVADHRLTGILPVVLYLVATLMLAWASWRFVEQPFRQRRLPRRVASGGLTVAALAIAAFAIGGHVTEGYPARLPPEIRQLLDAEAEMPPAFHRCIGKRKAMGEVDPATACVLGADAPPVVAIWGDSHAGVLADPLAQVLAGQGLALRELALAGCPPVPGLQSPRVPDYVICEDHNQRMFQALLHDPTIRVVILHAYWNYNVQRVDYDNGAGDTKVDWAYVIKAGADKDQPDAARFADLTGVVAAELAALRDAGKVVIVLGPVPDPGFNVLDRVAMRYWKEGGPGAPMTIPAKAALDYGAPTREILATAAAQAGAVWIDPAPLFCVPGGVCTLTDAGRSLYFDDNHLAKAGAARVVPLLAAAVEQALRP